MEIGAKLSFSDSGLSRYLRRTNTNKQRDAGARIKELCRKHGISDATYYNWKARYGGMSTSDLKRLKETQGFWLVYRSWGRARDPRRLDRPCSPGNITGHRYVRFYDRWLKVPDPTMWRSNALTGRQPHDVRSLRVRANSVLVVSGFVAVIVSHRSAQ